MLPCSASWSSPLVGPAHHALGSEIARLFGSAVWLKLALAALLGHPAPALAGDHHPLFSRWALADRVLVSCRQGNLAAILLLVSVLFVFAKFQIGMSRGNKRQFLGRPPGRSFCCGRFSSWFVVLLRRRDCRRPQRRPGLEPRRGALPRHPGRRQEEQLEIMVRAARGRVSVDGLARELRLPPQLVRRIGLRLRERGLLAEVGLDEFALGCDPDRTSVVAILEAVGRDPALDTSRRARENEQRSARAIPATASRDVPGAGQTLRELTGQPAPPLPAAADVASDLREQSTALVHVSARCAVDPCNVWFRWRLPCPSGGWSPACLGAGRTMDDLARLQVEASFCWLAGSGPRRPSACSPSGP